MPPLLDIIQSAIEPVRRPLIRDLINYAIQIDKLFVFIKITAPEPVKKYYFDLMIKTGRTYVEYAFDASSPYSILKMRFPEERENKILYDLDRTLSKKMYEPILGKKAKCEIYMLPMPFIEDYIEKSNNVRVQEIWPLVRPWIINIKEYIKKHFTRSINSIIRKYNHKLMLPRYLQMGEISNYYLDGNILVMGVPVYKRIPPISELLFRKSHIHISSVRWSDDNYSNDFHTMCINLDVIRYRCKFIRNPMAYYDHPKTSHIEHIEDNVYNHDVEEDKHGLVETQDYLTESDDDWD